MFAYRLDDAGITVGYRFPAGWPDGGRELAYRSFDTFRVD